MATRFMVNGEERTLELRDKNGIDWSADFIGNTNHGMCRDKGGNVVATEDDFGWWKDMIEQWEEMESVIASYKEQFDADEVAEVVNDNMDGYDLEDQPRNVIAGLQDAFGELR